MPRHPITRQVLLCGAAWWVATAANAQSAAPVGSPLDNLPRPALPTPALPGVQVNVEQPAAPAAAVLASRITPGKFDIEGVKSIPFDTVAALFAPLVGQSVTVAELVERSQQATALYQQRGYALSFFFVPLQDFQHGVVRIVAVEGHVQAVRIEGNAGPAEAKLREIAEQIRSEKPLRTRTFEHVTGLLGRLPGVAVQAQVPVPTSTDGATTLVIQAQHQAFDVSMGLETRKPTPRAVLTGVANNLLLPGSQIGVSTLLSTAKNDHFNALHVEQALGDQGWSVKGSVSQYRGDPDEQLGIRNSSGLQRQTEVERAEITASLPLRLSREANWVASGGLYGMNTRENIHNPANGAELTDETRVRAVFAQLAFNGQGSDDALQLSLKLSHGMTGLGASAAVTSNVPGLSGPGTAKLAFARLQAEAAYQRRFANHFGIALSSAAQYSPHSLPSSERISFGGNRFASGYAPGVAVGDSGWGVGAELNRSFTLDSTWLRQWQPYLLFEAARVHTRVGTPAPERLRSVSLGLRLSNLRHYNLDLALSRPTGDRTPQNPERDWRAHITLSYRLDGS